MISIYKSMSFLAVLAIGVGAMSCSSPTEVEKTTLIHKISISHEDTTDGSQKYTGDVHSGKYMSHTDSGLMYGSAVSYTIPDSLIMKDIRVKVNMWVKQGDFNAKNQLAVSLEAPDHTILVWAYVLTQKHINEANKWINVNDSVTIPGDKISSAGLYIKMFPYNPEGTSYMDADDIDISIYKVEKKTVE